ncbi:MAG: class I SAM-dependent methyltransferase [Gemmataceae bacterium]
MIDENLWQSEACAKAFWDQAVGKPYLRLLTDTIAYCQPKLGETWIDLGCGSGQLTQGLWMASQGQLKQIHALDLAEVNQQSLSKLARKMRPAMPAECWQFKTHDLSHGLPQFEANSVDGIVAGLAISYAESHDGLQYTDAAYNHVLADAFRVLRPDGRLVFSVNVPNPQFWKIFTGSFTSTLRAAHLRRVFVNSVKMLRYGRWLRREAARGRFHFFTITEIESRLRATGFDDIQHTLSYADQAYVVRAVKRGVVQQQPLAA